jgi:hypothetical protein
MDECGYENGKIYKIVDKNGDIIYVGSTKRTLKRRWSSHYLKCDEYNILLIENYSCESKRELEKYEQKFIDLYNEMGLINQKKAYRTEEELKEYKKELAKSDKYKEYHKKYQQTDKYKESQKKYYQSEKGKENQKKYEQSDKRKEYKKKYEQSDKCKEYRKEYSKKKANCPHCDKLMLKASITKHIKTACKKI